MDSDGFQVLTQWLTFSVEVLSAERLKLFRDLKGVIERENYPPAIATVLLAQVAHLPFDRDGTRLAKELKDIKKTLQASTPRGDDSRTNDLPFPGEQKVSRRPARWGSYAKKKKGGTS